MKEFKYGFVPNEIKLVWIKITRSHRKVEIIYLSFINWKIFTYRGHFWNNRKVWSKVYTQVHVSLNVTSHLGNHNKSLNLNALFVSVISSDKSSKQCLWTQSSDILKAWRKLYLCSYVSIWSLGLTLRVSRTWHVRDIARVRNVSCEQTQDSP